MSNYQKNTKEKGKVKKFAREEKIATYFEFFSTSFWTPLVNKIKTAPIRGINIIADKIGKFI